MVLNQAALDELRALDPDGSSGLLRQIISGYLADAPNLIRQMQTAVMGNDMVSLARHAHSLKSTSASLGATRVSQIACELEIAGRKNSVAGCEILFTDLNAAYVGAEQSLRTQCAIPTQLKRS